MQRATCHALIVEVGEAFWIATATISPTPTVFFLVPSGIPIIFADRAHELHATTITDSTFNMRKEI